MLAHPGDSPLAGGNASTVDTVRPYPAGRAHGVVVPGNGSPKGPDGKFLHEDVWRYLFTHPAAETGAVVAPDPGCRVAPPRGK